MCIYNQKNEDMLNLTSDQESADKNEIPFFCLQIDDYLKVFIKYRVGNRWGKRILTVQSRVSQPWQS